MTTKTPASTRTGQPQTQAQDAVDYKHYWVDEKAGRSSAWWKLRMRTRLSQSIARLMGLVAEEIYQVQEGQ